MKLISKLLITALLFTGCAPTVQYVGRTYSPSANVDIFFKESDIKREYEIMGKIDGKAWPLTDFSKIQDKIIEEAKKRGADAVVIVGADEEVISSSKNTTTNSTGGSTTSATDNKSSSTSWDASVSTTTTTNNQTIKVMRADFIKYKS